MSPKSARSAIDTRNPPPQIRRGEFQLACAGMLNSNRKWPQCCAPPTLTPCLTRCRITEGLVPAYQDRIKETGNLFHRRFRRTSPESGPGTAAGHHSVPTPLQAQCELSFFMWVRKEGKDLFIALRVKSHRFIEVRYRLVILTELVVDFPLVQVGRRIVGVGQRQLLWPVGVRCNCRSSNCRPCASLVL